MGKLIIISIVMSALLIAVLIKDFIEMYKTKKMLAETIENCLNILKEREEIQ